ncbi:MAG: cell division protein CrgA [Phycicoccus sp.]|nr:cell division protein CrgA [Phycicoccus sp.]
MPESKGRDKATYTPPRTAQKVKMGPNPTWYAPVMVAFMVIGLLWIATYYISGAHQYPVPQIGRWNLGAGFGFMMVGFLMTTRWR